MNNPVQVYEGDGMKPKYPDRLELYCRDFWVKIREGNSGSIIALESATVESITKLKDIAMEMESGGNLPKIEITVYDNEDTHHTTYAAKQIVKIEFRPSVISIFRRHP